MAAEKNAQAYADKLAYRKIAVSAFQEGVAYALSQARITLDDIRAVNKITLIAKSRK